MAKIKIYKNNPTAGGTDGTLVSSGTGLDPIESGTIYFEFAGTIGGLPILGRATIDKKWI